MKTSKKKTDHLRRILNNSASIIRKYSLGDQEYFVGKFHHVDISELERAWNIGLNDIRHREIIKNASDLTSNEKHEVQTRLNDFSLDQEELFYYLNSKFDPNLLKLSDEKVERRVRHILATRYIAGNVQMVEESSIKTKSLLKSVLSGITDHKRRIFYLIGFILLISSPRIYTGLTPVDVLTKKIQEKSKYEYRVGAICRDGRKSRAKGRGACSHHGGVKEWIYKTGYHKSVEECRQEAMKLSWLE